MFFGWPGPGYAISSLQFLCALRTVLSSAGCTCSLTVRKLACNKQLIQIEALRQNEVWNSVRRLKCLWSQVAEAAGRAAAQGRLCSYFKRPFSSDQLCVDRKKLQKLLGRCFMLKLPSWSGARVSFLVWGRGGGSASVGGKKKLRPREQTVLQLTTLHCTQ